MKSNPVPSHGFRLDVTSTENCTKFERVVFEIYERTDIKKDTQTIKQAR